MAKLCISLSLLAATALGASDRFKMNFDELFDGAGLFKVPNHNAPKSKPTKNRDLPTCQTADIDCSGLGARKNWLACIPEGYQIPSGKEEKMQVLEACTQEFCCGAATCASSLPPEGYGCVTEGLNDYDPIIKGDNLCPEGVEEGCTGDLTVCCEPATCASVLLTGGNSYDCTSLGLNNYDATKRGSVPCPGGLASGCRGDLTVCCEPATCESALPSDGFPCASAGLNDFQRTLKGGVICPEGIADGCLNDLTVCCEPATCLSAAPLDGYVCVLAGLNNFDADLKAGKFCPGGTAAGCLNDLSVCCEPATCFSVAEGGGEFGCSDAGFVDFNEFIRSDVPCPGGAASGCLGDPKVYLPVLLRALLYVQQQWYAASQPRA